MLDRHMIPPRVDADMNSTLTFTVTEADHRRNGAVLVKVKDAKRTAKTLAESKVSLSALQSGQRMRAWCTVYASGKKHSLSSMTKRHEKGKPAGQVLLRLLLK